MPRLIHATDDEIRDECETDVEYALAQAVRIFLPPLDSVDDLIRATQVVMARMEENGAIVVPIGDL